jgi:hypothetical protein
MRETKGILIERSSPPSISVVIPTVARPELVDALASVAAQTVPAHEVIVVADSTEPLPSDTGVPFTELRVGPGAGGNAARQAGIEAASGSWIALLDEDDVWHPDRLERQIAQLRLGTTEVNAEDGDWVATSRVVAMFSGGRAEIWPDRLIRADQTIPEYILRKSKIQGGVGFVQASTLLFPRELALRVPFDAALRFHQDLAWLVATAQETPGIRLMQVDAALVDYRVGEGSVSRSIRSRESTAWGRAHLAHCDARSRGDFLITTPVVFARRAGDPLGVLRAVAAAFRHGRPGLPAVAFAAGCFAVALASRTRMLIRRGR